MLLESQEVGTGAHSLSLVVESCRGCAQAGEKLDDILGCYGAALEIFRRQEECSGGVIELRLDLRDKFHGRSERKFAKLTWLHAGCGSENGSNIDVVFSRDQLRGNVFD